MRCIVLILLFTAVFSQITAQNDIGPDVPSRLAKLDAESYLQAIYDELLGPVLFFCPFDLNDACHLPKMMTNEIMFRYKFLDVPFELLSKVYNRLMSMTRWEDQAVQWWTEQLIIAWLRDYPVDLSDIRSLTTANFIVKTVATIQSDASTDMLWVLHVNTGERRFDGLIALQSDAKHRYQPVSHPVQTTRPGQFHDWERASGDFHILEVTDVNNDNQVEVKAIRNVSSGNEGTNSGRYYILEWKNGKLTDLFSEPMYYSEINTLSSSHEFPSSMENNWIVLVDSSERFVRHTHQRSDNFNCQVRDIREYVWRDGQFVRDETRDRREYDDTRVCAFRQAEELSWTGHYAEAISFYLTYAHEVAARSKQSEEYIAPNTLRFEKLAAAYAHYRRGIAYIMLGQADEAERAFEYARTLTDDPNLHILLDAVQAVRDPEAKCAVAQTFFARDEINSTELRHFGKLYFHQGYGRFVSPIPPPLNPLLAGCNIDFNPVVPTPIPTPTAVPLASNTPHPPEPTAVFTYPIYTGTTLLSKLHTQSPEEVLEAIDTVLQRQPDSAEALYERAFVLELMGRDSEATEAYARVPTREHFSVLRFLADLHLKDTGVETP